MAIRACEQDERSCSEDFLRKDYEHLDFHRPRWSAESSCFEWD